MFNCIAHNQEINGFFAASTLLQLLEFYTLKGITLKKILTDSIRDRFPAIIFTNVSDTFWTKHQIGKLIKKPATLFDNYECRDKELNEFLLFDYMKFIAMVKNKKDSNIFFSINILIQIALFSVHLALSQLATL